MNSFSSSTKIVLLLVLAAVFSGTVIAQTGGKTSARRNSPFAPNPKKRVAPAEAKPPVEIETVPVSAPVVASSDAQTPEQPLPEPASDATANPPAAPSENRSVASLTLEVAKRAATANLPPTEIYRIGVGDVLFISLQNAPAKESNYFTVLKDGTIDYPLAGEMPPVAGLTAEEIETLLTEKIKLYENPLVSVRVREHNSHAYTVLGLVEKPGEKFLQREALPLFVVRAEAIAQAKAVQAVIKRAAGETEIVSLKDKKYEEVLIFSGDIVEFSAGAGSGSAAGVPPFYYIGGEIASGGQKDFYPGITLTQAILASGGLKKSSVRKVIVRRKNEAGLLTPTEYDLKAIKDGKAADPVLEAGDTIEIGN